MKVVFVATIPSPYRVNFFNELGKQCELTVIFEKRFSSERSDVWKNYNIEHFNAIFLNGISVKANKAFCPDIIKAVKSIPYDVLIIGGYNTPSAMYLINHLKRKHKPFILSADGAAIKEESKISYIIKKHFISAANMWIGTSNSTMDYFCHYGADSERVKMYPFTSIYAKDILSVPTTLEEKSILREKLQMENKFTVIAVGQFIYRKGFDVLLKAAAKLPREIKYYIIGGEATEEYQKLIELNGLNNITFLPFMKTDELRLYYKAADIFVLPTREDIWGLVINEAAACALPIVTTTQCVAGVEIVGRYNNGLLVSKDDVDGLASSINSIYSDENAQMKMQQLSLIAAKAYTFESMAEAHIEIMQNYLQKRKEV